MTDFFIASFYGDNNVNRPLYETQMDLGNEQDVAKYLEIKWDAKLRKLPISYSVDWMLMRDNPVAFAELKCRKNESTKYPTLMLSLNKWVKGNQFADELGVPFLIICQWNDGLFFYIAKSSVITYGIGGRTDRGDSQDTEPVVYIPVESFKRIK
jgi:hypothetical protein